MISYEVSFSLILHTIINSQSYTWYIIPLFPAFIMFFISALAETNRPPFDLPEAEAELVAGYQVEYSSTPYLLFMIGEYLNIVMMCAMVNILFLGGWHLPWGPVDNPWLGFIVFYAKIWV